MGVYVHVPTNQYPVDEWQIKAKILAETPNISFAKPFVPPAEYQHVQPTEQPGHDAFLETVVEDPPLQVSGIWTQQWSVRDATPEEMAARKVVLVATITGQTQERLDSFARTRGYDGILSACTYASSTVEKFSAEGQYCVDARDMTWSALYELMAEVEAGQRPVPTGYADIEPLLPALVWPA